MRDDLAPPNLGQVGVEYQKSFFARSYRDIEMFLNRLLSKGPASVTTLTVDRIVIVDGMTGSLNWRSGLGTPEGNIVAPVGSFYTRTDGGAGTTLYVKESGIGNTGWIAK